MRVLLCDYCQRRTVGGKLRRYCSDSCRQLAYRLRKTGKGLGPATLKLTSREVDTLIEILSEWETPDAEALRAKLIEIRKPERRIV